MTGGVVAHEKGRGGGAGKGEGKGSGASEKYVSLLLCPPNIRTK